MFFRLWDAHLKISGLPIVAFSSTDIQSKRKLFYNTDLETMRSLSLSIHKCFLCIVFSGLISLKGTVFN